MAKAVALFSGGLDSTLAILTVLRQGIEVKALKFLTQFGCEAPACSKNIFSVAEMFGFEVRIVNLSDKFLGIVKNPRFGYGRNVNPCIDCRILMLKEAKIFMKEIGTDFIITGEVLGQRPMSQRKDTFYFIDKEAGVTDYVLRPLSAKLLKVTAPEARGIISRDTLYDLRGRSRKPQIALAREFGLADYPAPAGGCLLTEPNYAHRLKDLLTYNPDSDFKDLNLLKIGRHFRLSPSCKIIVGRNRAENEKIWSLSVKGCLLKVEGYGSPTTLVVGEITDEALRVAASICARYSDAKNLSDVEVAVIYGDNKFKLRVSPAGNEIIEALRIELKSPITQIQRKPPCLL
ncbi:MAG: 7-cyano-7-deazaguanine synthase [Thermodesulfovibrionales bacterium]|nr:7-cyano-7-deazaguanine synthase [Thermodesulfovibrionales bacterium]